MNDEKSVKSYSRLPVIKIGKKRYFRDDRLRQFRNVKNPHDYLEFWDLEGLILVFFLGR